MDQSFDKFISAKRTLTTQMKATGEVMSICDNFEGALMKAIRSLEQHVDVCMAHVVDLPLSPAGEPADHGIRKFHPLRLL